MRAKIRALGWKQGQFVDDKGKEIAYGQINTVDPAIDKTGIQVGSLKFPLSLVAKLNEVIWPCQMDVDVVLVEKTLMLRVIYGTEKDRQLDALDHDMRGVSIPLPTK